MMMSMQIGGFLTFGNAVPAEVLRPGITLYAQKYLSVLMLVGRLHYLILCMVFMCPYVQVMVNIRDNVRRGGSKFSS